MPKEDANGKSSLTSNMMFALLELDPDEFSGGKQRPKRGS